ncbi:TPA: hypothetical protein L6B69_24715 [Pseudomonas aeruginosa]|nr:hypothetical protein APA63_31180 [Pseudomonas aeruginosa]HBP5608645.1 hypothetical protein [Pseudomonas aeruginosa]
MGEVARGRRRRPPAEIRTGWVAGRIQRGFRYASQASFAPRRWASVLPFEPRSAGRAAPAAGWLASKGD